MGRADAGTDTSSRDWRHGWTCTTWGAEVGDRLHAHTVSLFDRALRWIA